MRFEDAHERWLNKHVRARTGERKGRLERGHNHGEKMFLKRVWWPLFGHFDHLHPEYEVLDWRRNPYFVDFVWIVGKCKFAFEIKGFGPHVQNTDRIRYRRELNRELFLQTLGFRVISIPYDELEEQPQLILYLLRSLLSPYADIQAEQFKYSPLEREVLSYALRSDRAIRPIDLTSKLRINHRTAVRSLQSLCKKGKLQPVATEKGIRVTRYELVHSFHHDGLW